MSETRTYPSGAPMPQYGPSTPEEFVADGLEWAYEMLKARDEMNAAVHCVPVRWSPVTTAVRTAIGQYRQRFADLDRCEHGRHVKDDCFSCPGGLSLGNPHLDAVIGYKVRGDEPIRVRDLVDPERAALIDARREVSS